MADDLVNALLQRYGDADPSGRHPDLVNALAQAYATQHAQGATRNRLGGDGVWPTLPPLPDNRPSARPYERPGPPRWEREVAETISPTMGAYGLAGLATTAGMDARHGKYDPETLAPLAAMAIAPGAKRGPTRAYHWSPNAGEISEANRFRPFSHFGSEKHAGAMAEAHPGRGEVMPVDLHIQNPLRIQDNAKHTPEIIAGLIDWSKMPKEDGLTLYQWINGKKGGELREAVRNASSPEEAARLIDDALRKLGHDGLVYRNEYEAPGAGDSYIATRPGSVRSPTTGETLFQLSPLGVPVLGALRDDPPR